MSLSRSQVFCLAGIAVLSLATLVQAGIVGGVDFGQTINVSGDCFFEWPDGPCFTEAMKWLCHPFVNVAKPHMSLPGREAFCDALIQGLSIFDPKDSGARCFLSPMPA